MLGRVGSATANQKLPELGEDQQPAAVCTPHLLQLHCLVHQPLRAQAKALLLPVQAVIDLLAGDVLHQVLQGTQECGRALSKWQQAAATASSGKAESTGGPAGLLGP